MDYATTKFHRFLLQGSLCYGAKSPLWPGLVWRFATSSRSEDIVVQSSLWPANASWDSQIFLFLSKPRSMETLLNLVLKCPEWRYTAYIWAGFLPYLRTTDPWSHNWFMLSNFFYQNHLHLFNSGKIDTFMMICGFPGGKMRLNILELGRKHGSHSWRNWFAKNHHSAMAQLSLGGGHATNKSLP